MNEETLTHFDSLLKKYGADCWWNLECGELLPSKYLVENCGINYQKTYDTLDVWFDSGTSWRAVFADREAHFPVDLVVEGSDQHRGWFQSLLLTSIASKGVPPYRAILSHGFVVDENGQKMSKSLGNIVEPSSIVDGGKNFAAYGADVLRYWVASANFGSDITLGRQVIERNATSVKKIRNTLKFIIGALEQFDFVEFDCETVQPLERWVLAVLADHVKLAEACYDKFEFTRLIKSTETLVSGVLSQVYFESIKANLYADERNSVEQRGRYFVLLQTLDCLFKVLAPILPFMMKDVIDHVENSRLLVALSRGNSHPFIAWPDHLIQWEDPEILQRFSEVLSFREGVHLALETARFAHKFFHGDFGEVSLVVFLPNSLEGSPLASSLIDLQRVNQLHHLLSVSRLDIKFSEPPTHFSEIELLKNIQFQSNFEEQEASVLLKLSQQDMIKCKRCRCYHLESYDTLDETGGTFTCCPKCLETLKNLHYVKVNEEITK
eukprot:TRINITY_DN18540_c0_g3_i2.p1 TRINITY_DN18540_c0_g3~~TRINITY_DN18540_c0_g3_i2.p1  ORF type:complete len:494 (-),score=111.63 TRINITY_DN18540_c0_g3_i2:1556-3037(-)